MFISHILSYMRSTATRNTDHINHSTSGVQASHILKKWELGGILSQGSKKSIWSASVAPSVPWVPISSADTFTFHSDTHAAPHAAHEPVAAHHPETPHTIHEESHHTDQHHIAHEEPKKGFLARMKSKVKWWFGKKKEKEAPHPPLVGSEVVNVGNKKYPIAWQRKRSVDIDIRRRKILWMKWGEAPFYCKQMLNVIAEWSV